MKTKPTRLNAELFGVHRIFCVLYSFVILVNLFLGVESLMHEAGSSYLNPGTTMFLLIPILPFALLHFFAALGAKAGTKNGRRLSRVIATFMLFGFPLYTLLGVYIFFRTGDKRWQSRVANAAVQSE